MGGASFSEPVKSMCEGVKLIEKIANSVPWDMSPDGDACVLDTRPEKGRALVLRLVWQEYPDKTGRWVALPIEKEEEMKVRPILPIIARRYGNKPSEDKPYVAMARFQ